MSENVGASSTSHNPKGLHGLYRDNLIFILNLLSLVTHSWSLALLEKPTIVKLLKNIPACYGTRRFTTVFTRALHWSPS
jgi:hypothetical protein